MDQVLGRDVMLGPHCTSAPMARIRLVGDMEFGSKLADWNVVIGGRVGDFGKTHHPLAGVEPYAPM